MIWVDGPDAEHFLHGLLSNDVAALEVGSDQPALLLNDKGHIRSGLLVHRDDESAFTLLVDTGRARQTAELLEEYHFSEKLEITGPEHSDAALLVGDTPLPDGSELIVGGWIPGTRICLVPQAVGDGDPAEAAAVAELLRIESGVPRIGIDTAERALPHEIGLTGSAVSFDKGCYLGQETVARIEYRGGVKRRLRGVRTADLLPPGAAVSADSQLAGTLTSTAESPRFGPIGLAVIRDDVAERDLTAGDRPAEVVELPFGSSG